MSKSKTKAEKQHMSRVAELGCIVCANLGNQGTPAELHHIRAGMGRGMRASNFDVLPLCPHHHRDGGHGEAFHAGRETWEEKFGTEHELLSQVRSELGIYA